MKKAFSLGIASSVFFAVTFVVNRSLDISGGSPLWSASLRYLFLVPLLFILLLPGGRWKPVIREIGRRPAAWIIWSTVGFGLFYLPLTLASSYGESWFVAACWELTIPAGILLTPLFGRKIPVKSFLCSLLVVLGVFLLQVREGSLGSDVFVCIILLLIAAFSYPLGNRKMMACCEGRLTSIQRVFGMCLCSLPFWIIVSVIAGISSGAPSGSQMLQCLVVALSSGIVATVLFFKATDLVRNEPAKLAAVEATQAGEVLFTLLGGILLLGDDFPSLTGWIGIALVVFGIVLSSLTAGKE